MSHKNKTLFYNITIYVLTIILFVMNFIRIFDNNLWADECYSIKITNGSFANMLTETASDVHPPLYYALLMLMRGILGSNSYVYHFTSLIPYIGILIFCLTFVRKHYGYGTSAILIILASISENSIKYNVEVRMYSLAAFCTLVAYFLFLELIKEEKLSNYIWFAIASLGVVYTQYLAVLPIVILYVALLVFSIQQKRRIKHVLLLYFGTIIGYLPWLIPFIATYLRKVETGGQSWINEEPSLLWCFIYFFNTRNKYYSFFLLILTVGMIAAVIFMSLKKKEKIDSELFGLVTGIIASAFPIIVLKILSRIVTPMMITRYYYPGTLIFWTVMAIVTSYPKWKELHVLQIAVSVLILIVCTKTYLTLYSDEKLSAQKCSETYDALKSMIRKDDMILTNNSQLGWTVLSYYFPSNANTLCTDISAVPFDFNNQYWCVLDHPYEEADSQYLSDLGYSASLVMDNGIIGDNKVWVYKLTSE